MINKNYLCIVFLSNAAFSCIALMLYIIMTDISTLAEVSTPIYIMEESRLRRNLELISGVARDADVEIILAFKAFALWRTFHIFRRYISATTASSLNEARLGFEEFGAPVHTFSPAYTDGEIDSIARMSSHLTFNSLSQYDRFAQRAMLANADIKLGLRVNPEYSEVGTDLYNPCAPGTRFGVTADKLPHRLPDGITGLHCHCHCESGADVLQRTLVHIEEKFSPWFDQIQWLNLGGGHLMTRADYDVPLLIDILRGLHSRYPHLHIILEPGSAFAWQTGPLVSEIVDIVEDHGIRTAILNVSFTCHMLEMPYWPSVRGAETLEDYRPQISATGSADDTDRKNHIYRLGGNSCLSGDFMSAWQFDHELEVGEKIIFEDMIHYTTVKTCMFNGIGHPSIGLLHQDGHLEMLRRYGYEDYRDRMD